LLLSLGHSLSVDLSGHDLRLGCKTFDLCGEVATVVVGDEVSKIEQNGLAGCDEGRRRDIGFRLLLLRLNAGLGALRVVRGAVNEELVLRCESILQENRSSLFVVRSKELPEKPDLWLLGKLVLLLVGLLLQPAHELGWAEGARLLGLESVRLEKEKERLVDDALARHLNNLPFHAPRIAEGEDFL